MTRKSMAFVLGSKNYWHFFFLKRKIVFRMSTFYLEFSLMFCDVWFLAGRTDVCSRTSKRKSIICHSSLISYFSNVLLIYSSALNIFGHGLEVRPHLCSSLIGTQAACGGGSMCVCMHSKRSASCWTDCLIWRLRIHWQKLFFFFPLSPGGLYCNY